MSYILDALKRAEAERSRGAVPSLHAQRHPVAAPASRTATGPWLWSMGAVLVVAAVLVAWWLGRDAAKPAAVLVPVQAATPTPVASAAAARPVAVLPPIPAAAPVAPASPVAPLPALRPVSAVPVEAPVPTYQDLPEAIRQQLPTLAISGATYSENPLYRMVIINGQVLHEGDTAAPGVVLEKIRHKELVLRTQGQRYAMKY